MERTTPNRTKKRPDRKRNIFTDQYIKSLPPESEIYQIREGRGFAIRILPSGVKSWYYIYTLLGKRRQMCLGNYPDVSMKAAHEKYRDAITLVKSGVDPLATKKTEPVIEEPVLTVSKLKELYIIHITSANLAKRSITQIARTLEHDVIPVMGDIPAAEIRRKHAIELVENVAKRAPGQARNVIKAARAMFSYAEDRDLVGANPFFKVGRAVPSTAPKSRERTLSDVEIRHVWTSLYKTKLGRVILFILVTAQRPGEVSGALWNEISLGVGKTRCGECRRCGRWIISSDRTKTRSGDHRVYLTDLALSLLPEQFDNEYVYPAIGRGRAIGAVGGMRPATMSQFISTNKYFGLPRWTPHDLRRTARTGFSALDVPERHAEAVLNHKPPGIKSVYDLHTYDKQKEAALVLWSEYLLQLVA